MPKKLTLLLISQTQLARAEVVTGKRTQVKEVWIRERLAGESQATLVDAAIRLGPKKTNEVWVLSTDFWSGVVHLASDVSAALDGEELDQAIGLEAETYSGISAFDSRLGLKVLPVDEAGDARWWVTQISNSDWHEIEQTVKQFGGKLAGMGHAALAQYPESLNVPGAVDRSWRLFQCFSEATIALQGMGTEIRDIITLGELTTQRNRSQLLDWFDATATTDELLAWVTHQPLLDQIDYSSASVLTLSNVAASDNSDELGVPDEEPQNQLVGKEAVHIWAETMAASLQTDRHGSVTGMPVVVAHKAPMSNQTATLVACGLGLIVALACFGFHVLGNAKLAELDTFIKSLNAQKEQLAADQRSVTQTEKSLGEKRRKMEELKGGNQRLSANLEKAARVRNNQQNRWLQLVSALAESIEGDCWVRGLQTIGQHVTIQGMATSNRDIAVFTSNLERIASPHGWRIHPAKTALNELSLIEFEVSLDVTDRDPAANDGQTVAGAARINALLTRSTSPTESSSPTNRTGSDSR